MIENRLPLTRRDFVKGTLGTTVGAATLGAARGGTQTQAARSSRVIVVRDANSLSERNQVNAAVLRKILDDVLVRSTNKSSAKDAWAALVKASDVIGLVPTDHLNRTHQELIDAVRESLIEAGIPKSNIRTAQGRSDQPKACTALIALPALKAHWLTGIGTVLKNYICYSDNPEAYHGENNAKLGEIWNLPYVKGKTRLVIVDALRPLCDKGPQPDPRYMWPYKGLIAGSDPVAVETVCLRIITKKRDQLRGEPWPLSPPPLCVTAADARYGLGTSKMEEIKIEHFGWDAERLV